MNSILYIYKKNKQSNEEFSALLFQSTSSSSNGKKRVHIYEQDDYLLISNLSSNTKITIGRSSAEILFLNYSTKIQNSPSKVKNNTNLNESGGGTVSLLSKSGGYSEGLLADNVAGNGLAINDKSSINEPMRGPDLPPPEGGDVPLGDGVIFLSIICIIYFIIKRYTN